MVLGLILALKNEPSWIPINSKLQKVNKLRLFAGNEAIDEKHLITCFE